MSILPESERETPELSDQQATQLAAYLTMMINSPWNGSNSNFQRVKMQFSH